MLHVLSFALTSCSDCKQPCIISIATQHQQDQRALLIGYKQHKQPSYMLQDRQITEEVRHTFEDIISKKSFPTKGKFYPGCEHGWALRGDDSDPKIRDGAADAFSEAVSWVKAHG